MDKCFLCPRKCGTDRKINSGFCGEKNLKISHVMLHHWEEPVISGDVQDKGNGTIFFTGCNLKCVYCQNWEISSNGKGVSLSVPELVDLFKRLEDAGALNINLVTPTHFASEIIEALKIYKPMIPVVWNTSGYESAETIERLAGLVDVFLTDLKYFSTELSGKYSQAKDYFEFASKAILKMREIVGEDVIENGLMKRGVIVRHMVLPGCTADSVKILDWIAGNLGQTTIVSIMNQYLPCFKACEYPEINRKVDGLEYKRVVNYAIKLGLINAYTQELASSDAVKKAYLGG